MKDMTQDGPFKGSTLTGKGKAHIERGAKNCRAKSERRTDGVKCAQSITETKSQLKLYKTKLDSVMASSALQAEAVKSITRVTKACLVYTHQLSTGSNSVMKRAATKCKS